MVDIHAHILIDELENRTTIDSKTLLDKMYKNDFHTIVAISTYHPNLETQEIIKNKKHNLDVLYRTIYEQTANITLLSGSEISSTADILSLLNKGDIETIANTRYIFVKYSPYVMIDKQLPVITKLRKEGIYPIMTELEQYKFRFSNINIVSKCIQAGALIHVDYGSILGHKGYEIQKQSLRLLRNHMVHVLGSNVSQVDDKLFDHSFDMKQFLNQYLEPDYVAWLLNNSDELLKNEVIQNQSLQKKKKIL